jgi:hypothetical protein
VSSSVHQGLWGSAAEGSQFGSRHSHDDVHSLNLGPAMLVWLADRLPQRSCAGETRGYASAQMTQHFSGLTVHRVDMGDIHVYRK